MFSLLQEFLLSLVSFQIIVCHPNIELVLWSNLGVAPDLTPVTEESLAEKVEGEEGRTKQTQTQQPLRETLFEAYKANLAQKTSSEQAVLTEGETQGL